MGDDLCKVIGDEFAEMAASKLIPALASVRASFTGGEHGDVTLDGGPDSTLPAEELWNVIVELRAVTQLRDQTIVIAIRDIVANLHHVIPWKKELDAVESVLVNAGFTQNIKVGLDESVYDDRDTVYDYIVGQFLSLLHVARSGPESPSTLEQDLVRSSVVAGASVILCGMIEDWLYNFGTVGISDKGADDYSDTESMDEEGVESERTPIAVLVVNGLPRSGKDTFADMLIDLVNERGDLYANKVSSVQFAYDILEDIGHPVGDGPDKTPEQRRALAGLKKVLDEYCDYSTEYITDLIRSLHRAPSVRPGIVVVFIREPDNISRLVNDINESYTESEVLARTLLVADRGDASAPTESDALANVSCYPYDMTVHNDGTLDHLRDYVGEVYEVLARDLIGKRPRVDAPVVESDTVDHGSATLH